MPNLRYEPHHRICNLRYGTHGYLRVLPLVTWIDGFSQPECCMPHSLGQIKNRTDLFSGALPLVVAGNGTKKASIVISKSNYIGF